MNIESISKFYQINQSWPPNISFWDHVQADAPKAGVLLPDFKEFDGIGVDEHNRMRFMFAQIPSDFSFPLPNQSDAIFVIFVSECISRNDRNNRMRFIRSSLTCQSPSDSIRFFKNRIRSSDCALPLPDFPSNFPYDPSNHRIIWKREAGLINSKIFINGRILWWFLQQVLLKRYLNVYVLTLLSKTTYSTS